jgi:NAD(P)-dependent dehydrogenase (short-subunit alcohol dehydrogenase family)
MMSRSPRAEVPSQAYNSSKTAINGVGVHYADALRKLNPSSLVISLDPGYNATNLNKYQGIQDPKVGANGYVVAITQGPETTWKSGEFRDQFGKIVPW